MWTDDEGEIGVNPCHLGTWCIVHHVPTFMRWRYSEVATAIAQIEICLLRLRNKLMVRVDSVSVAIIWKGGFGMH
jgi:hypothetical protein